MKTRIMRIASMALLLSLLVVIPSFVPARATGDFTISAKPSNLGRTTGDFPHRIIINVTSTGGFSGTVGLTEYDNGGITASFNPTSVNVPSGGFATSTLTLTISCTGPGKPPVTVQGTSGTLAHDVYITWGTLIC